MLGNESDVREASSEPWEVIAPFLAEGDAESTRAAIARLPPGDAPRLFARLKHTERTQLLDLLEPTRAATLLEQLPDIQIAELLTVLEPATAARIVDVLRSNDQADVLAEMGPEPARAVLRLMRPEDAADARRLAAYAEHTAGGVMITEYVAVPEAATVGGLLDDLQANAELYQSRDVQYIYVTGPTGELRGVLRLRDLVLTKRGGLVRDIMIPDAHSMPVDAPLDTLREFFATHPYLAVPVVDSVQQLVGIVRHADVAEAEGEQATSDLLKSQGIIGGEELRTMPVLTRARRRLSWLSINVILNIAAAGIIALYQDTLQAVIVLAVFLPIISDMSGCSGNQAIAVSMRELTLGMIKPPDAFRVWRKELSVGLINATALGLILGTVAFLWKGNIVLSLAVGAALALNTLVAVSLGGLVPLLLRGLRMDPALASGPILTTVTDMCGFFFVLSFATAALPLLT